MECVKEAKACMRLLPAAILILAWSAERVHRPSDRPAENLPEPVTDTSTWSDSRRLGDTTFFSRGRVITTVVVLPDSQWAVRPPVLLGLPNGPFQLPPDSLCTLGYSGTTLLVFPATVLQQLERTRECGARTFAQIRRPKLKDSYGSLSVDAARAELESWPWDGLCGRVRDSTLIAFYVGDDVTADEWGPAPLPTRLAQWDSVAGLIQTRCPGAPVAIRALPTQLEARPRWEWLTTAWAQYPGPRPVIGPPEKFFALQVASAKRQHLGLVTGLNLLDGSCGPAARGWCLPGIPGTTLAGTRPDHYQMSAAELMYYKSVAMTDPYVCASVDWSWGPNFKSDFHDRPDIQSAAKALSVIARQRARTSCVQR
jgi:hypothetical protein